MMNEKQQPHDKKNSAAEEFLMQSIDQIISQNGEDNKTVGKDKARPYTTQKGKNKDELLQYERDDNISDKTFEQFKFLKNTPPMGSPAKMSMKGGRQKRVRSQTAGGNGSRSRTAGRQMHRKQ